MWNEATQQKGAQRRVKYSKNCVLHKNMSALIQDLTSLFGLLNQHKEFRPGGLC